MTFWYFFMLTFGFVAGILVCRFFFPRTIEVEKKVIEWKTKEVPVEVPKYPEDYKEYSDWKAAQEAKAKAKAEKAAKKKSQAQ